MNLSSDKVSIEAPARLHFGVLDLRGAFGRWFGGIGAAAPAPSVVVSATASETLRVTGPEASRAEAFARRFLEYYGLERGAHVNVERTIPPHVGLGSGTQLALAVGRLLAEIHGIEPGPEELAEAVGRAKRSAIGTWTFAGGGFVLEGGRRPEGPGVAPLIARMPFPTQWWCVVGVPDASPGLSGESEALAFKDLPPPNEREVHEVSHLVLMGLLPALAEHDLETFGRALSEIQTITGRWFSAVQGGAFAPGPSASLVRTMKEWGVPGVGQSSWGPAIYGIVASEDEGHALAARVRELLGERVRVFEGPFRTGGPHVRKSRVDLTLHA